MSIILDAIVDEVVEKAAEMTADFIYKNLPKNAAEDQRLEDLKHVAVLGGIHD